MRQLGLYGVQLADLKHATDDNCEGVGKQVTYDCADRPIPSLKMSLGFSN